MKSPKALLSVIISQCFLTRGNVSRLSGCCRHDWGLSRPPLLPTHCRGFSPLPAWERKQLLLKRVSGQGERGTWVFLYFPGNTGAFSKESKCNLCVFFPSPLGRFHHAHSTFLNVVWLGNERAKWDPQRSWMNCQPSIRLKRGTLLCSKLRDKHESCSPGLCTVGLLGI